MELILLVEISVIGIFEFVIDPCEQTLWFVTKSIISFKGWILWFLFAFSFEFVVFELSFISEGIGYVLSLTLCVIFIELSFIIGTIFLDKHSFSICFSLFPLSNVDRIILFIYFSISFWYPNLNITLITWLSWPT